MNESDIMPDMGEAISRKDLHTFYLLDTSGSIKGVKLCDVSKR